MVFIYFVCSIHIFIRTKFVTCMFCDLVPALTREMSELLRVSWKKKAGGK